MCASLPTPSLTCCTPPVKGRRPPSLDYFLEYLNLTEAEFNAIVQKTVVAPHQPDFQNIKLAPRLHDLHLAYRARVK